MAFLTGEIKYQKSHERVNQRTRRQYALREGPDQPLSFVVEKGGKPIYLCIEKVVKPIY